MPIKITLSPGLLRLPQRIERALAIGREGAGQFLVVEIRQRYRADKAVASGATVAATRILENRPDLVRVGPDTVQAQFIERGRRGGSVPPWPIFKPILRQWANSKGLSFPDSALWFIARKIRTRGFAARYSVARVAQEDAGRVAEIFRRALAQL